MQEFILLKKGLLEIDGCLHIQLLLFTKFAWDLIGEKVLTFFLMKNKKRESGIEISVLQLTTSIFFISKKIICEIQLENF